MFNAHIAHIADYLNQHTDVPITVDQDDPITFIRIDERTLRISDQHTISQYSLEHRIENNVQRRQAIHHALTVFLGPEFTE